ncbi:MAG: patatin-like phospholipase family protein, partial [Burkholderiales bacterium]
MADENDWLGVEQARIASRRTALGVEPPKVETDKDEKEGAWGLALSGGGIRSATFALGVLQALAIAQVEGGNGKRTAWLRCFDYLSTVSGGGYVGAFFVSLFLPRRLNPPPPEASSLREAIASVLPQGMRGKLGLAKEAAAPQEKSKAEYCRDAAEHAYHVLQDDPPGRVRSSEAYDWRRRPLAWLRENGRYLTPTGAGDYVYAAGLALRNWFSLHYVIGTALVLLFALVAWLKASLAVVQPSLVALLQPGSHFDFFALRAWAIPDPQHWDFWWSPLWVLPIALVVLWLAPS